MPHSVLTNGSNLIEKTADLLLCNQNSRDYSQNLVVFPGKRPAHFLRKSLSERIGDSYSPPTILSMEDFIDRIYEKLSIPAYKKLETVDAVAFLFDVHKSMDIPMGGTNFLALDAFFPLGVRIFHDLEELLIEDVSREKLIKCEPLLDNPLPEQTTARLQSLVYFYDRFYKSVERAGYSSRSQRYVHISRVLDRKGVPWKRIIFSGFFGLTASERKLFKTIMFWHESFFIFQEGPGLEEQFSQLGFDWQNKGDGTKLIPPAIHFHRGPDTHSQVFVLNGLLDRQKHLEEIGHKIPSFSKTSVVLPSADTLFAVLSNSIPAKLGDNFNISLGYPLERTPTWGFIDCLGQLVHSARDEGLYTPDYLSLILHPYTKNIYLHGQSETTRIMFHAIEENLRAVRAKSFINIDEIESDYNLFELIHSMVSATDKSSSVDVLKDHLRTIHDELIRKISSFHSIGDFAGRMMDVLTFIYDHSSARLHPFFYPFAEAFLEQLDLLRKSRVSNLLFTEMHSYFNFLRRFVSQCFSPFEGTPLHGMQILGFLETRNLSFERVYVLDMNEGVLPATKTDETFIPVKVRRVLGLSTHKDRDKISAYYFHTLLASSKETHLFYTDNNRKEKSRFVGQLLWEKQLKDGNKSDAPYVASVDYKLSLDAAQPTAIVKTPGIIKVLASRAFDATSIDTYLKCPLKFYYRYVLRLAKKNDIGINIEKMDIGNLVHRILFTFLDSRREFVLSEKDMDLSEMNDIIQNHFSEVYGREHQGSVLLLKRQVMNQMKAFLQRYMIPLTHQVALQIIALEQKMEITYEGFRFQGVIDRIDLRDNEVYIIDYKTGSSRSRLTVNFDQFDPQYRKNWSRTIGSLQLPLYQFLYSQSHPNAAESTCMFLLLGKARITSTIELPIVVKENDRHMCNELMKGVIIELVNEILDIKKSFDPTLRSEDACVFCDYHFICGTQWQGR